MAERRLDEQIRSATENIKSAVTPISNDYIIRGILYIKSGKFEEGESDFTTALKLHQEKKGESDATKLVEILNNRAYVRMMNKKYLESIEDSNRSLDLDPNHETSNFQRAYALFELKRYSEALRDISRCVDMSPKNIAILHNRSIYYIRLKMYQECIDDCSKAIEILKTNPWVEQEAKIYNARGIAYNYLQQWENAENDLKKCLTFDEPVKDDAYANLGWTYHNLGLFEKALQYYEISRKLQPDNAWLFYFRGKTKGKMGKLDLAMKDLKKCLDLDPTFEGGQKAINEIVDQKDLIERTQYLNENTSEFPFVLGIRTFEKSVYVFKSFLV